MAFWGHRFIFDGIPCETYDLMLYDIGKETQGDTSFAHTVTIEEEAVGNRWRPLFYGVKYEKKLEFSMVFGVDLQRIEQNQYLDRSELDAIATWLAGHDRYKTLEIDQVDMHGIYYKCIIDDLQVISFGNIPYALKATVVCDGPYAYKAPAEQIYNVNGNTTVTFFNESSHNGYLYPNVEIIPNSQGDISIINLSDSNREFRFDDIPDGVSLLFVNNDTMVITGVGITNPYKHFNFNFLRLKRGENKLRLSGNFQLKLHYEFPVCPGG